MQNLPKPQQIKQFQGRVIDWFQLKGRKRLPWQNPASAYRVWISEVMLQQTQVDTVIPYFEKFLQSFPSIKTLAAANIDEVMHLWSGLGYYARARNLHKSALILSENIDAELPVDIDSLQKLPGIGRSTAGAILSLAFSKKAAILDGNIKRVLTRHYRIEGWPGKSTVVKNLWQFSEILTPDKNTAEYNQAMMDLGSLVCRRTNPTCEQCPLRSSCQARKHNEIPLYPAKKAHQAKPVKQQSFYLIHNSRGELLLYRRPPVGIWGGLWCLPNKEQLTASGILIKNTHKLNNFTHTFSHFTLQATIVTATTNNFNEIMDAPGWSWYDPLNPVRIGIPAPMINLLQNIKTTTKGNDLHD